MQSKDVYHLTYEPSMLSQSYIPPKMTNLVIFSVPCAIDGNMLSDDLCDIGANINVMPLCTFCWVSNEEKCSGQ